MGELFNSPHEWTPLITGRLIDYIRIHVSQAGGLTPVRKIAAMAEIYGVRTAWHGPGDVSPIGHAANVTLDLVCYNFGIQEYSPFNDRLQEVFHGCPVMKNGYLYANEAPGWGIEVDEKLAAKYPLRQLRTATSASAERRLGRSAAPRRHDHQAVAPTPGAVRPAFPGSQWAHVPEWPAPLAARSASAPWQTGRIRPRAARCP